MLHVDFDWELSSTEMIPDKTLNTDKLKWEVGDYWVVKENDDGRKMLVKVDPLVKFILEGQNNECS